MTPSFLSLIESKREGNSLPDAVIRSIVAEFTQGRLPDYQMAAFLMAVYFQGLNPAETRALTLAMRDSGEVLRLPPGPRPIVDKHSLGGIGDKVSLPLAPLLACLGFRVPMISGRGLGITGGTLDKLDAVPGYRTTLTSSQILENVERIGCVICGQTENLVPADKKLYALRDVTGTVPAISLCVSSILSKKLAEDLQALVLDVKYGPAAFMTTLEKARELARAMVSLGNDCGVKTTALLTRMDTPLGRAAGNWLEIKETCDYLEKGPAVSEDLHQLVVACAAHLLLLTGRAESLPQAEAQAVGSLQSGAPGKKWEEMLAAQGADLDEFHRRLQRDLAPAVLEVKTKRTGYVSRCDARGIGEIIRDLGGGRLTADSRIHFEVGVDRLAKPGEAVGPGAVLARIHAMDGAQAGQAAARLQGCIEISDTPPPPVPLISGVSPYY
jgi:pyrimidine-nucleoside phosphorylase